MSTNGKQAKNTALSIYPLPVVPIAFWAFPILAVAAAEKIMPAAVLPSIVNKHPDAGTAN